MMSLSEALSFRSNIMTAYKIDASKFETLAQHYFLLAYQECGTELGMGTYKKRNDLSVDNVLEQCRKQEFNNLIKYSGDYIAGRMAKLGIEFNTETSMVIVSDFMPRPDYQAWSTGKHNTYDALLQQAAQNAGVDLISA